MTNSGCITAEYKGALAQNGLRAIMGENAVMQPVSLQGVLLRETAVPWLRHRLSRCTPAKCWQESTSATTRATLSGSRWAQRRDPEERHRKILPPPEGVSTEIQKSDTVKF